MGRDGKWTEKLGDGLGREIDGLYTAEDEARNGLFAQRNKDEVSRLEWQIGRISQAPAVLTEDFSRYYLEKHGIIIA